MSFSSISDGSLSPVEFYPEDDFPEKGDAPSPGVSATALKALASSPRSDSRVSALQIRPLSRTVSSPSANLSKWDKPFLKRFSAAEQGNALKAIAQVSEAEMVAVLEYNEGYLDTEKVTAAILKAYLTDKIDEWEASKLLLRLRCLNMPGWTECLSLKNENDRALLLRGLLGDWDETQLDELAEKLEAKEAEFFFRRTQYDLTGADIATFSLDNILFHYGFVDTGNNILNLIVPPKLWQQLLELKFGDQAIQMEPVLGYSKVEKFSDYQKRIVNIPCDFTATPECIHDMVNGKDNCAMYQHDSLYHAVVESANPHRAIWTEMALEVKKHHKLAGITLLDRSCPQYVRGYDKIQAFWESLDFNFNDMKAKDSLQQEVLQIIANKLDEWQSKYGVDLFHPRLLSCSGISAARLASYLCKKSNRKKRGDSPTPVIVRPRRSYFDRIMALLTRIPLYL